MTSPRPPRAWQHEAGDFGERFVAYALPHAWVLHPYSGSQDYGIDFHVEVFADGRPTGQEFGIQVKTVDRFPRAPKPPVVEITVNNLLYIIAKPYPSIIVVVSRLEKEAKYAWIGDLVHTQNLMRHLHGGAAGRRSRLRVRLEPNHNFGECAPEIGRYLDDLKERFVSWFRDEARRRAVTDLYFDLHSSLDALIECISVIHSKDRTEDEIGHKGTFTLTLTVLSYGVLYGMTRGEDIGALGPIGMSILAICRQMRRLITQAIPGERLAQYETSQDKAALMMLPDGLIPFWPVAPRLACLFRDALRTIGRALAPWRDFNMQMSGLAASVIDYPEGGKRFPVGEKVPEGAQNSAPTPEERH
jgi:hypothetical protein